MYLTHSTELTCGQREETEGGLNSTTGTHEKDIDRTATQRRKRKDSARAE